jgi:hypothetical protein
MPDCINIAVALFPKKNRTISIVIQSGTEVISFSNFIFPTKSFANATHKFVYLNQDLETHLIFNFPFSIFH